MTDSLQLDSLVALYATDAAAPERVLRDVHRRVEESSASLFIHRAPLERMLADLRAAAERKARGERVPLFGVPFAVKDNIDVAGMPTTAACPAFEYVPARSAFVVERLVAAGAIVVGKTNLDQLATGLVGVRSPYGVVENPFDARYISGGSSSGSAVAVALGLVCFALGTDTAGSGRVPAALCNIVGLKPTRGLLSTRGVVPACRTLDCVSVFAGSVSDGAVVLDVAAAFDAEDPYSRAAPDSPPALPAKIRLGVPAPLEFFGDDEARRLYEEAVSRLVSLGAERVEVDFRPFAAAASLLYGGPWVAERLVAGGKLLAENPDALLPVLRTILSGALGQTALQAFEGQYRLEELRRATDAEWKKMDVMVLPTTPTTYTIADVQESPIALNSRLGVYTNFTNLLDLAAVAVPSGFRADGLPQGVTLFGPAHADAALARLASGFRRTASATRGNTGETVVETLPETPRVEKELLIAVAGAHLTGQPLNHQLTSRGGRLVRACKTSRHYRLYALQGTVPPKPGLVRDPRFEGTGIDIEVWALDEAGFGSFVDEVPAPLAIGTVVLADGTTVNGFVCEPHALDGAVDITAHGGWLPYLAAGSSRSPS
ncbi:MAG TPA: allophanate hydrolase [Polyangiaceae bacterium]|jgi:allophanate hydrolase|nr:allophanate hydrolase [Polyangiaceae bacterium]